MLGFILMGAIASVFFITENYFISMFTISIGLLIYVSGSDVTRIGVSAFTIFFSSKHLVGRAAYMQDTLAALTEILRIKRSKTGDYVGNPIAEKSKITLPNNPLALDIQKLQEHQKDSQYAEYLAHSYYVQCHELYEFSSDNFDFVSNAMPLFGLIGTIVGLIAMFDTLGADVTVEALSPQLALALKTTLYGAVFSSIYKIIGARFQQRLKALDYDYEAFLKALQTLVANKISVEVD